MDWGREAFFETLGHLRDNGLAVVGAGKDIKEAVRPAVIEAKGLKSLFWRISPYTVDGDEVKVVL